MDAGGRRVEGGGYGRVELLLLHYLTLLMNDRLLVGLVFGEFAGLIVGELVVRGLFGHPLLLPQVGG